MTLVKSLILGSAAGLLAAAGAQAADLPYKKAAPVEYVKVCDAFGAGFFYIPGTDTCLKVGGQVRAEYTFRNGAPVNVPGQWAYNLAGQTYRRDTSQFRDRAYVALDARNQTEWGTLRTNVLIRYGQDNSTPTGPLGGGKITVNGVKENAGAFQGLSDPYLSVEKGYIEFMGLTAGRQQSFFDFDAQSYEILTNSVANSNQPINMLAYTVKFGGGFSATLSAEDRGDRIIGDSPSDTCPTPLTAACSASQGMPSATGKTVGGVFVPGSAFLSYAGDSVPDVVGNLRVDQSWGSAQVSGAFHQVDSIPVTLIAAGPTVEPKTKDGFAVLGGTKILLPMLAAGDSITVQGTYEEGAMDYINALNYYNGLSNVFDNNLSISVPSNDAFVLGNGSISMNKAWGIYGAARHYFLPNVYASLFGAYLDITNPSAVQATLGAGTDNAKVWQIGGNVVWQPIKDFSIGGEALYSNMKLSGLASLGTGATATPADSDDVRFRLTMRRAF
jgi:hypothetical protein